MPGDIIYSGTPENVGPVVPGDVMQGFIAGLPTLDVAWSDALPHAVSLISTLAAGFGLALYSASSRRAWACRRSSAISSPASSSARSRRASSPTRDRVPARRDRRHAADVRRRPPLLARRPARRAPGRAARAPSCRSRSRRRSAVVAALLWGWRAGRRRSCFGLALSVASTVVLLKALEERGALDSPRRADRRRLARRRGPARWCWCSCSFPPLARGLGGGPAGAGATASSGSTLAHDPGKVAALHRARCWSSGARVRPWLL